MSKSIEDYRNIIKILKLQLLKVREENGELSHTLGIASENETSSFTPKITHYGRVQESFAKNILAFLNFAHRCELIGLTPEMVFRIADKKRDKKVTANSFAEILKRVKLRMSEVETSQLMNLITRGNQNVQYDEYLQCLSAFQINSEKYPLKSSRTYVQLCLLKFGSEAQSYKDADKLYREMNAKEDLPYLSFENYVTFVRKNLQKMDEFETIAVFVGLDVNSECQVEKSIFRREIGKAFSIVERGVNLQEEFSSIKEPSAVEPKESKKNQRDPYAKREESKKAKQSRQQQVDMEIKLQEQTGEQAGNKAKKIVKKPSNAPAKAEVKLSSGDSSKIIGEFKKLGIRITDFMMKLVSSQGKKKQDNKKKKASASETQTVLIKSFTIHDFTSAIKEFNKDTPKKKILELFKALDTGSNGTIDTSELLKLWLRGKEMTDSDEALRSLLYRHLKQTQFTEPLAKFKVLGAEEDQVITLDLFTSVFTELELSLEENQHIMASYGIGNMKVKQFSELLKTKPVSNIKKFVELPKNVYEEFKSLLQKINGKRKDGKKNLKKLMRLETGEKSTDEEYWETIFTDEWACWDYCLETASKLTAFWRDHEFGPTKSDPAGIRSIIGNESNPPPGLPTEPEPAISWLTFEEILAKNSIKEKVIFMQKERLLPNDVVQGKLGDCWYVSALSIIANNEQYIRGKPLEQCKKRQEQSIYGVYPFLFNFFAKFGMYVFKYYKKFQPVYVVVDDLFPVETSSSELLFAKSPNEGVQWVAFLQKSYAKLHHTYSNLISGEISQGLNDLTNALPIKEAIQKNKPESIQKIRQLNREEQMMGCSITAPKGARVEEPVKLDDEKCGLLYSHAYSILDFVDLKAKKGEQNLLRVRNPWGNGEWMLDWSDNPKDNNEEYKSLQRNKNELKKYYKDKIDFAKSKNLRAPIPYDFNANDGEFLMKFQDFNNVFTNLFTGYNLPSSYTCQLINQRWDNQFSSGSINKKADQTQCKKFIKNNHQYLLTIQEDNTDVLMFVTQQDGRLYRGEKYPFKELINGTLIFSFNLQGMDSLEEFDLTKSTTQDFKFEPKRDVNFWYKYKKGKYAIIPCRYSNEIPESDFQFRIYSSASVTIKKIYGHKNVFRGLEQTTRSIDQSHYKSFLQLLQKHNK